MGKRSDFTRVPRDFYPTPRAAVLPLLPHLRPRTRFIEPCAGDGTLVDILQNAGHWCVEASDIEPRRKGIFTDDVTTFDWGEPDLIDCFITNPPWDRRILHPTIANLAPQAPTWLLFDADWSHTVQSIPYLPLLRKIVSVGRVKWIADSPFTGKDNCAWHLFAPGDTPTEFWGRTNVVEDVSGLDLADL